MKIDLVCQWIQTIKIWGAVSIQEKQHIFQKYTIISMVNINKKICNPISVKKVILV